MFPNQTPEQPQQPTQPQPIQPPVEPPVVPSTPEVNPVAPESPAPNPFGAVPVSQPTPTSPPQEPVVNTPAPKKPFNKKLVVILAVVVLLLGLAAAAVFVVLPMLDSKSGGGTNVSTSDTSGKNDMQFETVTGDGFSILVPASYTKVPSDSKTSVKYSQDGTDLNTIPMVSVFTYDASMADSLFTVYSNPIADTVVSKGYTFEKVTFKGFEAVKGQATVVKDGKDLYVSHSFAVKTTQGMTLVTVTIPVGDDSGIEDQVTNIFDSLSFE